MAKHQVGWLNSLAFAPGSTEFTNRQIITALNGGGGRDLAFSVENPIMLEMADRELTYIKNFFILETEDTNLKKAFEWVIYNLYMYGMAAITKLKDDYMVSTVANYEENLSRKIVKATLQTVILGEEKTINYVEADKGTVIIRANYFNKPWWMFSMRYYHEYAEALRCLSTNRINSTHTKMFIEPIANKNAKEELELITREGSPFILSNKNYQVEDMATANNIENSIKDVEFVIKRWEKFRGIRHNLSRKDGERNLQGELENDSVQFSFIEQDKRRCFEYMLDDMKEKGWGVNASIKTLVEVEEEKEEKVDDRVSI